MRQQAIAQLDGDNARSVRAVREVLPGVGRNAAARLVRRHRFLRRKRRRRLLCRLEWHTPGTVWAIDGTWLPWPVEGAGRRALVMVDLGARAVLDCRSIPSERADAILACLQDAVARFGAPLVIKWDNGSGFVAGEVRSWCHARGITLLHSPPRRPTYNGACEVHNRWAKARIVHAATVAGATGRLVAGHLAAACTVPATGLTPPPEALRRDFHARVHEHLVALAAGQGLADQRPLGNAMRRSLERVAARRALQECHILTIRGRDYRW